MGHTGTLRMIVLLGAVINSAKPYTFSQVHAYVHKLSQCFKYLYNRRVGAFRNCHRVALCKCARETVHSFTKQEIATLYQKKYSSILKIKHCMLLQTGIPHPFARKKHCTVLKKQTPCMVLPNGTHPPFARKKNSRNFWKKRKRCMVFEKRRLQPFARKTKIAWF